MGTTRTSSLGEILSQRQDTILSDWMARQTAGTNQRGDLLSETDLRRQSQEFLNVFLQALASESKDIEAPQWDTVRGLLGEISRARARLGFTPSETATFIFSLKQPLSRALESHPAKGSTVTEQLWSVTTILDNLALLSTDIHQKSREEVISRQQRELLELSTPVVKLWDGVLALPLIGTLDSERTQVVMENLLQTIVESGAAIAIIDITGVPTVDTLVAQHLLKTVAAARLMGAECIISGIRPQIAATIVHLGVDLSSVVTKATLADAFRVALKRNGLIVFPAGKAPDQENKDGTHSDS